MKNLLCFDPCLTRECGYIISYLTNLWLQGASYEQYLTLTRGDISYTFDQNTFNCNLLFLLDTLSN